MVLRIIDHIVTMVLIIIDHIVTYSNLSQLEAQHPLAVQLQ